MSQEVDPDDWMLDVRDDAGPFEVVGTDFDFDLGRPVSINCLSADTGQCEFRRLIYPVAWTWRYHRRHRAAVDQILGVGVNGRPFGVQTGRCVMCRTERFATASAE